MLYCLFYIMWWRWYRGIQKSIHNNVYVFNYRWVWKLISNRDSFKELVCVSSGFKNHNAFNFNIFRYFYITTIAPNVHFNVGHYGEIPGRNAIIKEGYSFRNFCRLNNLCGKLMANWKISTLFSLETYKTI